MRILFLVLFMTPMAFAQLKVSVKATTSIEQDVSEATAKQKILFDAAYKAMLNAAPELGFSKDTFEKKLAYKFNEYFKAFKEKKLIENYGSKYNSSLSDAVKSEFLENIEKNRDNEWVKFTRALEHLRAYSFENISRDPKAKNQWSAIVNLELDKTKLSKTYRRIMSDDKKSYQKIYLIPDIFLENFTWADLGVDSAESFLTPLSASWLKWLDENLPSSVNEAEICQEDCLSYWSKWSETSPDEMVVKIPLEYSDSVWLKLDLSLRKISKEDDSRFSLTWNGRVVLLDANTKRVISSFELGQENKAFKRENQKSINSSLASAMYRSPLGAFIQISKTLQDKSGINRLTRLVIKGHQQLFDVMAVIELLKTRGASLGLEAHLDNFSKNEAQLICYYKGEEKSFTDLLSGLKELKSSKGYTLVNEFNGVHHILKLLAE